MPRKNGQVEKQKISDSMAVKCQLRLPASIWRGDAVYANCTVGNVALCPRLQPSSRRYGDLLHLRHVSYG